MPAPGPGWSWELAEQEIKHQETGRRCLLGWEGWGLPAEAGADPEPAQGYHPGIHLTWVPGKKGSVGLNTLGVPGPVASGEG